MEQASSGSALIFYNLMAKKHIDRAALIATIRELKELSNEQKSDILQLISEQKKYGIVWEDSPEDVEENLRVNVPVLVEDKDRAIISNADDAPNHILIEGDNLEALTALSYTHEGKIDVIYIDPPYNTGAKNWKYNNDYVDSDDAYRHSKFISFMRKRFIKAKKLLTEKGIIICAIDDYEEHNVRHIMDDVFGEKNRLGTITVIHNPRGRNDDSFIATMHEYLLFYAKDATNAEIGYFPLSEKDISAYNKSDGISAFNETSFIRTGNNSLRTERPGLWYEIFYNPTTNKLSLNKESDDDILLLPINGKNEERCWRWSPETFEKFKDTELFVKNVKGEYKIYKKRRITNIEGRKPRTVWTDSKYDASSNGIVLLQNIFDGVCPFPYPKSIYAVYDSLFISAPKDGIILDFFAGSGTTLHATMQLNAEDGGHRQCILCTNNENNICEEVTYERNKRVINGYTTPKGVEVEGLHDNSLRYYKIKDVPRDSSTTGLKKLMSASTDLLCIKNDLYEEQSVFGNIKLRKNIARYFDDGKQKMLIIYKVDAIESIVEEIKKMPVDTFIKVYVFSTNNYAMDADFEDVSDKVFLCALPAAIYNAYRKVLPRKNNVITEEEEV